MIERIAFPVRISLLLAIGVLLIGGALAFASNAHAAKPAPRTQISQPIIGCDNAVTTQTSIGVQVCAGATGLPAGFTLQWLTADALALNGGVWPSGTPDACDASFS